MVNVASDDLGVVTLARRGIQNGRIGVASTRNTTKVQILDVRKKNEDTKETRTHSPDSSHRAMS